MKLEELLSRPGFAVMDGGMGSTIEDRGISVRNALWGSAALLDERGLAENDRIHADFMAAGAEILIANSHNASLAACAEYGGEDPARLMERVNRLAVESARRASGSAIVAGCIGSAEPVYSSESRMTPAEVAAHFEPQAGLLASLPIDLLLFETVSTRSEVEGLRMLVERLSSSHPELPIGIGLTCNEQGTTHGGVTMEEAAHAFDGVRLLFVQCTRHDLVERPLDLLLEHVDPRRTGVYANDGRRWIDRRWHGDRITPEAYAAWAARWAERGIAVIGGCCGTGPEHVAALMRLRDTSRPH